MRSVLRALRRFCKRSSARRKASSFRPALEILEDRLVPSGDFVQTNLVSNVPGMAGTTDPNLVNPWGLAAGPGGPWWVANEGSGTSTLYNGQGQPQPAATPLIVTIPTNPGGSFLPHGSPTGIVFNSSGAGFGVSEDGKSGSSVFLFASLDGTISGWNPNVDHTHAIVEATQPGAVFTGLAIGKDAAGDTLIYAADNKNGVIDVYDQNFKLVAALPGNFSDPNLPANFKPFNVQNINKQLYVEYEQFDPATGRPVSLPGSGIVDVYNTDGQFQKRLISNSPSNHLSDPWGVALAPSDFGAFANDLLVGNFGDGHIDAFNAATGKFAGQLTTSSAQPFEEDHLWSLHFGNNGTAGPANTLFFTAGINGEKDGLFGSLQAVPQVAPKTPIVPNLNNFPQQTISTVPPSNGDLNPYGVAFVPRDFQGGGALAPGDILVSNFNDSANVQATGSTIVKIGPDGQQSVFFQGPQGLGLTTALGVLPQGFVLVGSAPATTVNGTNTVANGGLIVLDSNGNEVMELSDSALLQGPWDLTVHNVDATHAQVFVSNVLSGTVTRIDLTIPNGGTPQVESKTQIASGYAHRTDPNALVVGPTGLTFDAKTGTLYVASTGDNAVYAIHDAAVTNKDQGTGKVVVDDPQHLHGPLALALAPNGDLIAANGDAVNADPNQPNELVEFTPHGKFVGQFQIDTGAAGAAFGLAVQRIGDQVRFAAVDDNTNSLNIWTFQTAESSMTGGGHEYGMSSSPAGSRQQQPDIANLFANNPAATMSTMMPPSNGMPPSASMNLTESRIDAYFQMVDATLLSLESDILARMPQLAGMIQSFNAMATSVESAIAAHPIDDLSGKV
jgi:uncharacterized protein (TIGR03118 family)